MEDSENMILIADAGSTKTEWCCAGKTVLTQGINPFMQTEEDMVAVLSEASAQLPVPSSIRFYGAGCTPEKSVVVKRLLSVVFPCSDIEVYSDLLAAAHALCGHKAGVACILGTGSNSCLYDGERIVKNTPALGFILGDEGSGAVLGKLFLNALLKGRVEAGVAEEFHSETGMTQAEIINRVYRQPMPNRFLASLSAFICKHRDNPSVRAIIEHNFSAFFDNNIAPYFADNQPCAEICFVGSIAFHYQDILRAVASAKGYTVGRIMQSPMSGLTAYYSA